jgi:nicotinamide-nucleotide amidase
LTVGTGESLTAGLLAARIADVPGASTVLRGGVVAYATDLKAALLGVSAELLAERGAVDPDVALAMAAGARERLRTDLGVATTGVAGPDPQDGVPPGTAYVAVAWPGGGRVRRLDVAGDRQTVRGAAVCEGLALLLETLQALS